MNKTGINDLKEEAMVERLEKGWQEAALAYDIGTPFGAFSIAMDELKTAIAHIRQQEARIAKEYRRGLEKALELCRKQEKDYATCVSYDPDELDSLTNKETGAGNCADLVEWEIRSLPQPPADQKGEEPRHE